MDTCNMKDCTDRHLPTETRSIKKIVLDAAFQYGHVFSEILNILLRVYMDMCQIEIFSVSHAGICARV